MAAAQAGTSLPPHPCTCSEPSPCSIPGYKTRYDGINLVTIRENTEGGWAANQPLTRSAGSKGCASLHVLQQWLLLQLVGVPCLAPRPALPLLPAWCCRRVLRPGARGGARRGGVAQGAGPSAPCLSRLLVFPGVLHHVGSRRMQRDARRRIHFFCTASRHSLNAAC